ncbi:tetratricopeptide repeat protein [Phenylobacterium sp.]|uniref:tetratricopeptide repeat protein n=1 Tax=Phenylobacterium sp. TaxID=1871053 RepID=UPI0011FC9A57|nr:tetratricopeptide repeat protein [Phenylobacterium sp.]TAL31412.1 MAG: tetratricopeptide repeat protein [Phenylobacterium sp.]
MRIGALILTAIVACASPAWSQSETELYESGANAMAGAQREVTQRNVDVATKALRDKDYKTARKYAQSVTRADPKRVEAWLLLGSAQQGLQDWKGARTTYTTAVRLHPTHPEARAGLGVAYARTGDPKATVQLAWLETKLRECSGCYQAGQLSRLKADVETAIRETAAKGS